MADGRHIGKKHRICPKFRENQVIRIISISWRRADVVMRD